MSPLALSLHFLQAQPDSRLIALAREGHEPAFEALVRRYHKELLAYCRRLQPRSASAEDALQQALLQAWKALRAGAEVREARPWLYRIAHNVSLNHLRIAVAVPQEAPEETGGQDVHQLVEQRLQVRAALADMAALPALQRDVFVRTAFNGASHEEIAGALGLTSGAVRGLIYRARATLRSAAAALIPSPAVHWAIRRAESRTGGAGVIGEALAGGGGAGVAAAIVKGGAVLTVAGAVAGAGGAIFTHSSSHPRRHEVRVAGQPARARTHPAFASRIVAGEELGSASALRVVGSGRRGESRLDKGGQRTPGERGRDPGSGGADRGGASSGSNIEGGEGSRGGSGGDASTTSSGGSDGGALGGATTATSSDGTSGSGSGGSDGGTDGGSSGSSGGSTSSSSGPDGGTTDGSPSPSSGTQLTAEQMTSDGGSGSDGGPTSGSTSSSGSGQTTTTSSH